MTVFYFKITVLIILYSLQATSFGEFLQTTKHCRFVQQSEPLYKPGVHENVNNARTDESIRDERTDGNWNKTFNYPGQLFYTSETFKCEYGSGFDPGIDAQRQ